MAIAQRRSSAARYVAQAAVQPVPARTRAKARPVPPVGAVRNPTPRRVVRPASRIALWPLVRAMAAALALAGLLCAYLSGHAQMTDARYKEIRLQQKEKELLAEQRILHNTILERRKPGDIEGWAQTHGFYKASGEAYVLKGAQSGYTGMAEKSAQPN